MLFRPVYLRTPPLTYVPPVTVIRLPPKKESPPPVFIPPRIPTPPPMPVKEPPSPSPEPYQTPVLISSEGLTKVFPEELTNDVLSGRVDFYLVDERGVTLFQKKHISIGLKFDERARETLRDYPFVRSHLRVLERRRKESKS